MASTQILTGRNLRRAFETLMIMPSGPPFSNFTFMRCFFGSVTRWTSIRPLAIGIDSQDYDAVCQAMAGGVWQKLPTHLFKEGGTTLKITLIPKSERGLESRPVGMHGVQGGWIDERTPIRNKIRQKAGHYGEVGKPFLVAINALASAADRTDVVDALFGSECYTISRTADGHSDLQARRDRDGVWCGPEGAQYQRLSGVLVFFALLPWTVASRRLDPVVYHNPWAMYPLATLPGGLAQVRVEGDQLVPVAGRPPHELIGVSPEWPQFDDDD